MWTFQECKSEEVWKTEQFRTETTAKNLFFEKSENQKLAENESENLK